VFCILFRVSLDIGLALVVAVGTQKGPEHARGMNQAGNCGTNGISNQSAP